MENRLFALRLSALRQQKGVSAREMSLALGQNTNYINRIENGKIILPCRAFSIFVSISV